MAKLTFSPALFDLPRDVAADLPIDLIQEWAASDKTLATAEKLLAPTLVRGTLVSSDTAGLSRLSRQKELIEVLALISQPKEIVYGFGKAIGGQGAGIWVADNTQMFYPDPISPRDVLSCLIEVQRQLASGPVHIGIGAHYGNFYSLGGGFYGAEADFIEQVAEDETAGGEIVISQTIADMLESDTFSLHHRDDLADTLQKIYRVLDGPGRPDLKPSDFHYPIPFSEPFYQDLRTLYGHSSMSSILPDLNKKYLMSKVVVLIEKERVSDTAPLLHMLNDLALDAEMKMIAVKLLPVYQGEEIKTIGSLGIYIFENLTDALAFSKGFRELLMVHELRCSIGIDEGNVLVFHLGQGRKDISGEPVNIASKMAQDCGEKGNIYITERTLRKQSIPDCSAFQFSVSGVDICGVQL